MVETITHKPPFYNPRFKPWAIEKKLLYNRFNGLYDRQMKLHADYAVEIYYKKKIKSTF